MGEPKKRELNYIAILFYIHLHFLSVYAVYLVFYQAKILTVLFLALLTFLGMLGATAGAHRLWAHRSYEASSKLRIFLMVLHTLNGQGTVYNWVLRHRFHHKHFNTAKDPYQMSKGFLYSHLFANLLTPLPEEEMEALAVDIDTKDLDGDAVVAFQKKFFWPLLLVICFLLPINAPVEYFNESIINSAFIMGILRYTINCHITWLIHSAPIIWGMNDKHPTDTNMIFLVTKSFWPQYHYFLPWDYKTGEFGTYGTDSTSVFVLLMAALGSAKNLCTIDSEGVKRALAKCVDAEDASKPLEQYLYDEAIALQSQRNYFNADKMNF